VEQHVLLVFPMNSPARHPNGLRSGTQAIERAVHLLRELTLRARVGWGLRDLSERCALSHSTTHRLLQVLVREGLAVQRASDRRYLPGPLVFNLGLAMSAHDEFVSRCVEPLQGLADRFEAQAILFLRSGGEWVCGALAGPPAYLGGGLEPGSRRPLLTSAGGIAMLIALSPDERDALVRENLAQLAFLGGAANERLLVLLDRSLSLGYAWNRGEINRGVHSLGLAIRMPGTDATVLGAISLSGAESVISADQVDLKLAELRATVSAIESEARRIFAYLT
jgi:DNA-binding IclR family transcriptional regulator